MLHVKKEYPKTLFRSLKSGTLQSVFDMVSEDDLSLRHHYIFRELKETSKTKQNALLNFLYTIYRGYIKGESSQNDRQVL